MSFPGRGWMCGVPFAFALGCAPAEVAAVSAAEAREAADRVELARAGELRARHERAFEAYLALARRPDAAPEVAAEAAFRAGELARAAGELEPARAAFESVRALEPSSPFAARAGLELGHLARREERFETALVEYLAVVADAHAEPRRREEAELMAARMRIALGRTVEARATLARLAREGRDPRTVVRAYDEWALSLAAAGELEAGAGVLEECRAATRERAREQTELGDRVRRALERMRAPDALADAVEERRRRADTPPPEIRAGLWRGVRAPG